MWRRITDLWPNLRANQQNQDNDPDQYELIDENAMFELE